MHPAHLWPSLIAISFGASQGLSFGGVPFWGRDLTVWGIQPQTLGSRQGLATGGYQPLKHIPSPGYGSKDHRITKKRDNTSPKSGPKKDLSGMVISYHVQSIHVKGIPVQIIVRQDTPDQRRQDQDSTSQTTRYHGVQDQSSQNSGTPDQNNNSKGSPIHRSHGTQDPALPSPPRQVLAWMITRTTSITSLPSTNLPNQPSLLPLAKFQRARRTPTQFFIGRAQDLHTSALYSFDNVSTPSSWGQN